jgi:FAD/FMN-containing dehydrogenase
MKKKRQIVLGMTALATVAVCVIAGRPAWRVLRFGLSDVDQREPVSAGHLDDASRLNSTAVREVWPAPADPEQAEKQLADLLKRAARDGLRVSIAGARHSMGGHTIYPDGVVIDMTPFRRLEFDEEREILRAGSGATWSEILPFLDARRRSVAVMQSNNSFTVGGSLSVNCHGWQYGQAPIASTVESFRLMKADGSITRCSREQNSELFSLVLGGYGLFGIILDAELRVVPNVAYRLDRYVVPVDQSLATYQEKVLQTPGGEMVYARLNIVPDHFFEDVILNVFSKDTSGAPIPKLTEPGLKKIRRAIFRGSAEDAYGKEMRWLAETKLEPYLKDRVFSRNQLFNEGVEEYQNRSAATTDILHEYFVPPDRVATFLPQMREILLRRNANLLNVTVRHVREDVDSFLRYADQEMFCFVMLFVQERTPEGEAEMEATTRELIDAALAHRGRYYLPYRLHATPEQFQAAYPQADEFFQKKREHDPGELFQNQFYLKHGKRETP